MKDKRGSKRSAIELAASFGIGEDPRPEREAKISDISAGGFCFTSQSRPKIGEPFQIAVDLDTQDQVMVTVEAVWVQKIKNEKKYRVGVRLVESDGPDFERFMDFYRKQI